MSVPWLLGMKAKNPLTPAEGKEKGDKAVRTLMCLSGF